MLDYYSEARIERQLEQAETKLLQTGRPQALVLEESARRHTAEQVVLFRLQNGTVTTQVISPSAWRYLVQGHAMQTAVATADLPHAQIEDLGVHARGWPLRSLPPDVWATSSTAAAGAAEGAPATVAIGTATESAGVGVAAAEATSEGVAAAEVAAEGAATAAVVPGVTRVGGSVLGFYAVYELADLIGRDSAHDARTLREALLRGLHTHQDELAAATRLAQNGRPEAAWAQVTIHLWEVSGSDSQLHAYVLNRADAPRIMFGPRPPDSGLTDGADGYQVTVVLPLNDAAAAAQEAGADAAADEGSPESAAPQRVDAGQPGGGGQAIDKEDLGTKQEDAVAAERNTMHQQLSGLSRQLEGLSTQGRSTDSSESNSGRTEGSANLAANSNDGWTNPWEGQQSSSTSEHSEWTSSDEEAPA